MKKNGMIPKPQNLCSELFIDGDIREPHWFSRVLFILIIAFEETYIYANGISYKN